MSADTYAVSGWTLGAPGSGIYASKTINLADYADYGTLTLQILNSSS